MSQIQLKKPSIIPGLNNNAELLSDLWIISTRIYFLFVYKKVKQKKSLATLVCDYSIPTLR